MLALKTKRIVSALVLGLLVATAFAVDREHQVKAEFVYKFSKYIEWPARVLGASGSPFEVAVTGQDTYGRELDDALTGTTIQGHPVVLRRLQSDNDIASCRLVIVGSAEPDRIAHLARLCKGTGTVLVGESPDFAKNGGTIGFVVESNHIRFDVNLDTARKADVSINLKLVSLARNVYRG
jgi:F420-0:gamma-glutamyl ligase